MGRTFQRDPEQTTTTTSPLRHPTGCTTARRQHQSTNEAGDYESHQIPQVWKGCRTRRHTTRSPENRCPDIHRHVAPTASEDLGDRNNTSRLEERLHFKTSKRRAIYHHAATGEGFTLLSIPGKVLTRIILDRLKTALDTTFRDE